MFGQKERRGRRLVFKTGDTTTNLIYLIGCGSWGWEHSTFCSVYLFCFVFLILSFAYKHTTTNDILMRDGICLFTLRDTKAPRHTDQEGPSWQGLRRSMLG